MNDQERYQKLRTAAINLLGVEDDLEMLTAMRDVLAMEAGDPDAKASMNLVAALIETRSDNTVCRRCGADNWKTVSTSGGVMRQCESCDYCRWPIPQEKVS